MSEAVSARDLTGATAAAGVGVLFARRGENAGAPVGVDQ
jgi:hypothetical protein